jgi:hypothetical protein
MRVLIILLALTTPARAADKALILNDQEQQEFLQVLDDATKMRGIAIAPVTVKLLDKLRAAPVVKDHPAGIPPLQGPSLPPQGTQP